MHTCEERFKRLVSVLTLYLWIFGHKQQTPSQCSCCGVSTSSKQVCHCKYQVLLMVVSVYNVWVLRERTSIPCIIIKQTCEALLFLLLAEKHQSCCHTSSFCFRFRKQSTSPLHMWGFSVSFRCLIKSLTSLTFISTFFNISCRFFIQLSSRGNML